MDKMQLEAMNEMIQGIRSAAESLIIKAQGIQAIERNADRILASSKMLELNLSDLLEK
jgi:hypothetical protein